MKAKRYVIPTLPEIIDMEHTGLVLFELKACQPCKGTGGSMNVKCLACDGRGTVLGKRDKRV